MLATEQSQLVACCGKKVIVSQLKSQSRLAVPLEMNSFSVLQWPNSLELSFWILKIDLSTKVFRTESHNTQLCSSKWLNLETRSQNASFGGFSPGHSWSLNLSHKAAQWNVNQSKHNTKRKNNMWMVSIYLVYADCTHSRSSGCQYDGLETAVLLPLPEKHPI